MRRTAEVEIIVCDGCGKEYMQHIPARMELTGFYGTICEIGGGGGSSAESWYAHTQRCISPAIRNALKRAWGHEDV
jgi:hypothetical protein